MESIEGLPPEVFFFLHALHVLNGDIFSRKLPKPENVSSWAWPNYDAALCSSLRVTGMARLGFCLQS